jgi:hypothetical protein
MGYTIIVNLKRWPYWQVMGTIIGAILGPLLALYISYSLIGKDYFDVSEKILKLENLDLKFQKDSLLNQKVIVENDLKLIELHKDRMSKVIDSLNDVKQFITQKEIEATNKLKDVKYESQRALSEVVAKSENEKTLIPIKVIIDNIAGLSSELNLAVDDKTYQSLINKLAKNYRNTLVKLYINKFINNDTIHPKAKTDVLIAIYLATKDQDAITKMRYLFSKHLVKFYSNRIHWSGWSKDELHNNIKLVLEIISKENINNFNKADSLNLILEDIIGNYTTNMFAKQLVQTDNLLSPNSDYLSFISLLKAYRHVNIDWVGMNNKRTAKISYALQRWKSATLAFVLISIEQEIAKGNVDIYLKTLYPSNHLGSWGGFNYKTIFNSIPDANKNIEGWIKWKEQNSDLIRRLKEPNFETYMTDQKKLKEDFK